MLRQIWRLTPAVVGAGNSGRLRLTAAMDKGGRWCLTVMVMDDCCDSSGQWTIDMAFNGGGGGGIQWRQQRSMVMVWRQ
jgi:hypothetical protein